MDFNAMKSAGAGSALDAAKERIDKMSTKFKRDERYWQLTVDIGKVGSALIRFLPPPEGEDDFAVRYKSHGFKGLGKSWFIENCPTSIGGDCPICERVSALYDTGTDANIKIARNQKARTNYVSNILVVEDPACPENNGKVFLYRYGAQVFGLIEDKIKPEFPDQEAVCVYDFWAGADFRLRSKNVSGYQNYKDASEFMPASELMGGDDTQLKELWKTQYPLQPILGPSNYKSYAALESGFNRVTGGSNPGTSVVNNNVNVAEDAEETAANQEPPFESNVDTPDEADGSMASQIESLLEETDK